MCGSKVCFTWEVIHSCASPKEDIQNTKPCLTALRYVSQTQTMPMYLIRNYEGPGSSGNRSITYPVQSFAEILYCVTFTGTLLWHHGLQVATCASSNCRFLLSYDGVLTRSAACDAAACTSVSLENKGIRQLDRGVFAGMLAVTDM